MADENRQFDQQVHDAFERIELSEGAQDRILANLLAAQARKQSGEDQEQNAPISGRHGKRTSRRIDKSAERRVKIHVAADEGADDADGKVVPLPRKRLGWRRVLPFAAVLAVAVVVVQATIVIGGRKHASEAVIAPESDAAYESKKYDSVAEDSAAASEAEETSAEGSAQSMATNDSAEPEATPAETEESETDMTLVDYCPRITLEDGTQLTALREGLYTEEVSPDEVGELVGEAAASAFDDSEYDYVIPCTVYTLKHEGGAYAVRYKSETTYWRCEPMG